MHLIGVGCKCIGNLAYSLQYLNNIRNHWKHGVFFSVRIRDLQNQNRSLVKQLTTSNCSADMRNTLEKATVETCPLMIKSGVF